MAQMLHSKSSFLLAKLSFLLSNSTTTTMTRAAKSGVSRSVRRRIDYSRMPELKEEELKESIGRGSGPGGQSVNKASNCVRLMHVPTGINVRVHETRSLIKNRELARERLRRALDNFLNKEWSVENQIMSLERERREREKEKRRMKREERLRSKREEEEMEEEIEDKEEGECQKGAKEAEQDIATIAEVRNETGNERFDEDHRKSGKKDDLKS